MNNVKKKLAQRRLLRRTAAMLVVVVFFLVGYNSTVATTQTCSAQYSVSPPIPLVPMPPAVPFTCGCAPGNQKPCTVPGSTAVLAGKIEAAYYSALVTSSAAVENYIGMAVDTLVQTVFSRLEQVEQDLVDWFDTYWHYNFRPSLQDMTEQANVAGSDQAMQIAAITDAEQTQRATFETQEHEARAEVARTDAVNTETCAVATASGGLGSANVFSRGMRRAWQQEATATAFNRRGAPNGPAEQVRQHAQDYENLFCNPGDNGGRNNCGTSDPAFYNADVQVSARMFNALTIPVDKDIRHNTSVQHMIDNMVGRSRTGILDGDAVQTAAGKQIWMERRSYVARKNAARATPNLIASWRMPGGAGPGGANCESAGSSATAATPAQPPTGDGDTQPVAGATNQPTPGSLGPAILAMGTNGDRSNSAANVQSDTYTMITRLQNAGYRVVVVLPVNRRVPGNGHDFPAYNRAVRAAATQANVSEIIEPSGFNPGSDGYHISPAAAQTIASNYRGAPTFGDSNSRIIASATGGHAAGRDGAKTSEIVRSQFPNGASAQPRPVPASFEPGSCSFVAALREGAGVPLEGLSDNPSYREIIHAIAIDRINSGAYAVDKIGSAERQQMEKLVLNAIYLMQLRDYYELLERTALNLSVQVGVMSDQYPLPNLSGR